MHGPPFIAQGVTDRCQRRGGQKCNFGGSCNSAGIVREQWMNSGHHLTLTVGDKGIKCPSPSTPKVFVHASPFDTAVASSPWIATVYPRLHSHPPRVPGRAPRATRGQMSWSAGTQRNSPRQAPCRGLDLAGPGSLPGSEACRSPGPRRDAYSAEACLP